MESGFRKLKGVKVHSISRLEGRVERVLHFIQMRMALRRDVRKSAETSKSPRRLINIRQPYLFHFLGRFTRILPRHLGTSYSAVNTLILYRVLFVILGGLTLTGTPFVDIRYLVRKITKVFLLVLYEIIHLLLILVRFLGL